MTRHGLRVGPAYPFPKYRGDIITLGNSSREQVEDIRAAMVTGEFHEVVELDEAGQVIEPTCGCVTSDRRWKSDPLNGDPSGCYCDCSDYGYEGCEHEVVGR